MSPRKLKKSQEAKMLNSTQSEFNSINEKAKEVDSYLYTLKVTNEAEYNYFETLKDKVGNEINIVVNLEETNTKTSDVATTTGFSGYPQGDKILPSSGDKGFQITLYSKSIGVSADFGFMMGRTFSSFANEIGDIKYYMENVKDKVSLQYWQDTGSSSQPGYKNPDGAGQYSYNYEFARTKDVKDYKPKEGEVKDNVKNVIKKK
jgi:hypothetical protein